MRWLQMRVEQLADQLNIAHARPGRAWAQDESAAEVAMAALVWGESYTVTLVDDDAVYVFTAQPNTGGEPLLPGREASWPI
ncbi:hypothetical protein [Kitasatospora sp. NPDC051914]|uniref:hypothetical protein n=1 Tax=Kitasatospora sp. NPDC051914 TaxID=3154945 RepID=UPI003420C057